MLEHMLGLARDPKESRSPQLPWLVRPSSKAPATIPDNGHEITLQLLSTTNAFLLVAFGFKRSKPLFVSALNEADTRSIVIASHAIGKKVPQAGMAKMELPAGLDDYNVDALQILFGFWKSPMLVPSHS